MSLVFGKRGVGCVDTAKEFGSYVASSGLHEAIGIDTPVGAYRCQFNLQYDDSKSVLLFVGCSFMNSRSFCSRRLLFCHSVLRLI